MDTQLSKVTRPLPLIPHALRRGFERTGRTQRVAADVAPLLRNPAEPERYAALQCTYLAGDQMGETHIDYKDADEAWKQRIAEEWGETAARHMHIADGFSILALYDGKPVGLISVYWRKLPPPLSDSYEGYIDIIEVLTGFRRQGIATRMVEISAEQARKRGVYQLRAWSSEDKTEAIPMWKVLGFGLCPATTYPRGQEVNGYFVCSAPIKLDTKKAFLSECSPA